MVYKVNYFTGKEADSFSREYCECLLVDIIKEIDDEVDFENLDCHESLRDQTDLDSMDFLDIVMELRKRHKIQVPEKDYSHLATMAGSVDYIDTILNSKPLNRYQSK